MKRREIVGSVNEIQNETLKKSRLDAAGDLSSMPIHMADAGTDTFEQEFALGLMDSERKILREIDDALERIQQGVYGICEVTGKTILKARLEATPWARYSVEYARRLEQGLAEVPEEETSD
ncbi:MAG: TraR/DksA family transcriptional regulator [Planctomycetota bacterium]